MPPVIKKQQTSMILSSFKMYYLKKMLVTGSIQRGANGDCKEHHGAHDRLGSPVQ